MLLLSLVLVLTAFSLARNSEAQVGKFVGTQTCINCHNTWLDNDPETRDVTSDAVSVDYPPLNLRSSRNIPWYTIPEGYVNSLHNIPAFDTTTSDEVPCEACHGSGQAHFGTGAIPIPIPNTAKCTECHNSKHGFDSKAFLKTAHANPNMKPRKFFDQPNIGTQQAKTNASTPYISPVSGAPVGTLLYRQGTFSQLGDAVSRNNRIEECSVCHQYAMQYPQFRGKIAQGDLPRKPEVSCGACHDAHIVAPDGLSPAVVTSTVVVTAITGTNTIASVAAVPGRQVNYINNKPYKIGDNGAQDTTHGIWTRGSAINRPQTVLIKGDCAVAAGSDGSCNAIRIALVPGAEGFVDSQVKEDDTIFLSGVSTATVPLPADAAYAGKPVTLTAELQNAGFRVMQVVSGTTLLVDPPVKTSTTLTYVKNDGKTATLTVPFSFCGSTASFEVRDMWTNTEELCGSCHTRGAYKYTKWGKTPAGTTVNLSPTHNVNVGGQYKTSGHANKLAPAFEEFSSTPFGGSHQAVYPFDMSITGAVAVGNKINKGNRVFALVSTPSSVSGAYLSQKGNTSLSPAVNNYACNQCHNGLSAIDYLNDVQGTSAASVMWGDATVVCITCHDPHKDEVSSNGKGPNLRKPVKLSYNINYFSSATNPRGGINKFMDGTDIPSGVGQGIICLFCHQGRESGYTVYKNISNRGVNPYTQPDKVISATGVSFQNPHYLESGAILWSKNNWEYLTVSGTQTPNKYSNGIPQHQQTNCVGCHMAEPSANDFEGGHTWRPRIEVCQKCHPTAKRFQDIKATGDYNGNGVVETAFAEIGTINPDTGLFGQLKAALAAKGIFYNPDTYPYYFTASGSNYTAWTTNTLSAAFNLSFLYKAGNCAYVHNVFYSAQILQDSIKAIGGPIKPWVRPAGDRNATDYSKIVIQ
jgi:hypothetical protein